MLFDKNGNGDEEIAELASWAAGHEFRNLKESVILAEEWLRFVLGHDVATALDTFYHSADYDTPTTDVHAQKITAVEHTQRALLNYAYRLYAPKGTVHFDNTGVSVKWDDEYRPAKDELPTFLKALENGAFAFLNMLIRHMDSSPAIFPEWANGRAKKKIKGLLIRSAHEFSELFNINSSEAFYFYTADKQRRAQREILQPAVGKYWADLLTYHANQNSFENTAETDIVDNLPPTGSTKLWLVTGLREFWQWDGNGTWHRYCADVRQMHPIALQLVAEFTIYLKTRSDITELRENPIGSIARIESHLKSVEAMAAHQKEVSDALAAKLVEMRGKLEAATEEEKPTEKVYIPSSTGNSFML